MNAYNPYALNPNPIPNQQGYLTQDQLVKLQRAAYGFTLDQSNVCQQAQNMTPSIVGTIKQYNY
ncbi:hypothetical protein QDR66_03035 [Acinetobacter baumannii]|uniref:hypothetical protein n=1 Tax=Acinetobacter baumannii TaxID=470 RepID=UPI00244D195A|nr:hypothetical protein [Acinetobacter baumannii]MDH2539504.1 hypothetical protein [Acinetobacter baumannii]